MAKCTRAMAFALLVWGCGPPVPPTGPDGAAPLPDGLAGSWHSDVQGVSLELDLGGTFEWKQGDLTKTGAFWVEGEWLVLAVDKRYVTRYAIMELATGRLVIQDPAGTRVSFSGGPDEPPASGDAGAPAGDVEGVWANVGFGVRIELAGDGTFVWKQGDLVETGTYSVASGAIHMTTGGHTSPYGIVSMSADELVIKDPTGNELPLARVETKGSAAGPEPIGKASLLAGAPPIKIVDLGKGGSGPTLSGGAAMTGSLPAGAVAGPGGIFHFVPPDGWKVDEQKVCGNKFTPQGMKYTCWKRNDLLSGQAARVHFDIGAWVTWAAPGSLEKVSPGIDAMLAAYGQDRTSVSDDISEMNGYEVFSTRIDGRDGGSDNQLNGRIIGIHFGDLLVVGVLALSADPETLASWGGDVEQTLDSMSFDFSANDALTGSIQGSWSSGGKTWTFWSDGTYLRGEETGSWAVHGTTLVMAANPQGEGDVAAHPVSIQDGVLTFGEHTLEKK
ncbi:MAG: hypothetical protein JRG91_07885 [Deltaproteobacteria bacterium]|nr:hypothetical protein [Deltaproteobacteria bacterium]